MKPTDKRVIELRRATAADAEAYLAIGLACESPVNKPAVTFEAVEKEIAEKSAHIVIVNGTIAGYITYEFANDTSVYIAEVQLYQSFQGAGVGPEALKMIMDGVARETHVTAFSLVTHPRNERAKKAYAKLGFMEEGEPIPNYMGTGEPRITMVRRMR